MLDKLLLIIQNVPHLEGKHQAFLHKQLSSVHRGLLYILQHANLVRLRQKVGEFLERRLGESSLPPQIGSQESVGLQKTLEGSLHEVSKGLGGATGRSEHIFDTSELQDLLRHTGSDNTRAPGSRDKSHGDRATLSGNLARNGMGLANLVTPVSTTNRDNRELGKNDSTTNSSSNFLAALNAKTDMTVIVTDDNEGFEPGTLSGAGLLLHGHDLHDLVLECASEEKLHNLVFFDREREEVDVLEGLDFSVLYESAELGDGHPFLLLVALGATATAAPVSSTAPVASASPVAPVPAATEAAPEASPLSASLRHGCDRG